MVCSPKYHRLATIFIGDRATHPTGDGVFSKIPSTGDNFHWRSRNAGDGALAKTPSTGDNSIGDRATPGMVRWRKYHRLAMIVLAIAQRKGWCVGENTIDWR